MTQFKLWLKDDPVQNLAYDLKPPDNLHHPLEEEIQMSGRKLDVLPPEPNTTTAIIHQEQSPWLSLPDFSQVMNVKNVLQRAKSMNINTGKPTTSMMTQVSDDTNVRYNWTASIKENNSHETELDNSLTSPPSRAVEPATAAEETDQQNAVGPYTGAGSNGAPESEGQSDYQLPMSVGSDQWSSYDPCLTRDKQDGTDSLQQAGELAATCYDTEAPFYVNTSAMDADAAGDDNVSGNDDEEEQEPEHEEVAEEED